MAHIWYEGKSHRYTFGGTKFKVICQDQGQILRSHFSKNGRFHGHKCFTNTACYPLLSVKLVFFYRVVWLAGTWLTLREMLNLN